MPDENTVPAETAVPSEESDALLSRLRVIEGQPLDQRAVAFVQLHDELRQALEGADTPRARD